MPVLICAWKGETAVEAFPVFPRHFRLPVVLLVGDLCLHHNLILDLRMHVLTAALEGEGGLEEGRILGWTQPYRTTDLFKSQATTDIVSHCRGKPEYDTALEEVQVQVQVQDGRGMCPPCPDSSMFLGGLAGVVPRTIRTYVHDQGVKLSLMLVRTRTVVDLQPRIPSFPVVWR